MEKHSKVLVLGARGMLGQEMVRIFQKKGEHHVIGWDIEDIDLTHFGTAREKILAEKPKIIVNCVAYNAVDACETDRDEYEKAKVLNIEVPKFLAKLAHELDSILVHYSTDYVFNGKKKDGYTEADIPHPTSKYGDTKWRGEEMVLNGWEKAYIIRLSRLFGQPATSSVAKKSFFAVMFEKGKREASVTAVDAEVSSFTYAPDLAEATVALLEDQAPFGIYHLPNEGAVTWYEATKTLFRLAHLKTLLAPVSPEAFPRPVKRPLYSVLRNTKRPHLRPYTKALKDFLGGMVQ